MQTGRRASRAICPWMVLLGWVFLGTGLSAAQQEGPGDALGAGACQVDIEGSHIKRLTLESGDGYVRTVERPGTSLSLPAGKYNLRQISLEGGYHSYPRVGTEEGSFALTPEAPYRLKVGAPLKPSVKVARWGRFLTLDYRLLDAGGRVYFGEQSTSRPQFTVYRGDREIGSGSFEYG